MLQSASTRAQSQLLCNCPKHCSSMSCKKLAVCWHHSTCNSDKPADHKSWVNLHCLLCFQACVLYFECGNSWWFGMVAFGFEFCVLDLLEQSPISFPPRPVGKASVRIFFFIVHERNSSLSTWLWSKLACPAYGRAKLGKYHNQTQAEYNVYKHLHPQVFGRACSGIIH